MPLPDLPTGIETQANKILTDLVSDLSTRQSDYLAANGRYWQGIRTHATVPADGGKVAPTKTTKPHYQAESWADLGVTLPSTMEIATEVHQYDGPRGKGYTVTGIIVIAGETWQRTVNVGPETERAADWVKINR